MFSSHLEDGAIKVAYSAIKTINGAIKFTFSAIKTVYGAIKAAHRAITGMFVQLSSKYV